MARNRRIVAAPSETVFGVLADASNYDQFVVGTKRVRRFDPPWPRAGSAFHHTVGFGPLLVRDVTVCDEVREPHLVVLRAHLRSLAVNRVTFRLRPLEQGTEVEVEEHPVEGAASRRWNTALDRLLWLRNQEMLRRLKRVAEGRLARQMEATESRARRR